MQARVEVLQQQGVVQGNQAPADHDTGQQVSTQTYVTALVISPCLPNNDLYAAVYCSVCSTAQLVNRSPHNFMSLPWSSAHICQTIIPVQLCFVLYEYCTAGKLLVPSLVPRAHQLPFRLTPEGFGC